MDNKNIYSNEQLIDGIKSHNHKIISFIYQHYFPMIRNIIKKNYKGTVEDAKDVFQDSLIVIYEGVMSEPPLKIQYSFFNFLAILCRRKMIGITRKRYITVTYENEYEPPIESEISKSEILELEILELIKKTERIKLYQKHFNEIGEKCQKLIKMVLEGFTIKEITIKLDFINENYTKRRRNQCKESLFKKIYFDSQLKKLINGKPWTIREIPRW